MSRKRCHLYPAARCSPPSFSRRSTSRNRAGSCSRLFPPLGKDEPSGGTRFHRYPECVSADPHRLTVRPNAASIFQRPTALPERRAASGAVPKGGINAESAIASAAGIAGIPQASARAASTAELVTTGKPSADRRRRHPARRKPVERGSRRPVLGAVQPRKTHQRSPHAAACSRLPAARVSRPAEYPSSSAGHRAHRRSVATLDSRSSTAAIRCSAQRASAVAFSAS
jgi:hypothetical protein